MRSRNYKIDGADNLIAKRRRVQQIQARKSAMKWIGIICLVAILVIFLFNVIPPLIKNIDIIDNTYRPRDVERQYHQIQKMRDTPDKYENTDYKRDPKKGGGS